jgi:hypothetical protein
MILREDAILALSEGALLWFLETERGGEMRAVSAVPSAVTETGVHFHRIYRSFGDVYPTEEAASALIPS